MLNIKKKLIFNNIKSILNVFKIKKKRLTKNNRKNNLLEKNQWYKILYSRNEKL